MKMLVTANPRLSSRLNPISVFHTALRPESSNSGCQPAAHPPHLGKRVSSDFWDARKKAIASLADKLGINIFSPRSVRLK
jgi:hypothetical protein